MSISGFEVAMAEFVVSSPDSQCKGKSIIGMIQEIKGQGIAEDLLRQKLHDLGLQDAKEDGWYSTQAYLDLLRWVGEYLGGDVLKVLGRAVPATATFPPDIHTLERALKTLDIAYSLNHRGESNGGYLLEWLEGGRVRIHCDNPYGCLFDTGILEGLIERFAPPGCKVTLTHLREIPCRREGGSLCIYQLDWRSVNVGNSQGQ